MLYERGFWYAALLVGVPNSVLPFVSYCFWKLYVPVVGETPGMNSTGVSVNRLNALQVTRRALPAVLSDLPSFVPHEELVAVTIVVLMTCVAPLKLLTTAWLLNVLNT